MILEEFSGALAQVAFSLFLVFLLYLIFFRKTRTFKIFAGFSFPPVNALVLGAVSGAGLGLLNILVLVVLGLSDLASGEGTMSGTLKNIGPGPTAIALIAITAFVKTALAEEIFFRGLIAKRLIGWLGFPKGNVLQAGIFGAVHLLLFLAPGGPEFGLVPALAFFLLPALSGWVFGYLNENQGKGSIAPGWLAHGILNAVSYPVLAFFI